MQEVNSISRKIKDSVRKYEFKTFLIGASLPAQLYDREDSIRARLKIRGMENIKNHLTRELGMALSSSTGKKVNYLRPDITISLAVDKENNVQISVRSRPIALYGRYVKKVRGIPQRQEKERCRECSSSSLAAAAAASVEGIIAKKLTSITEGQNPSFSWIGGEDQTSLVLGSGRPFFVRIFEPRVRRIRKNLKIQGNGVTATIRGVLDDIPDSQIAFRTRTKMRIRCEREVTREDMEKLRKLEGGFEVRFTNRSTRVITKNVYSMSAKRARKNRSEFDLTIEADGGLAIKQFVGGQEFMSPNISAIVGSKCECLVFDILDVKEHQ